MRNDDTKIRTREELRAELQQRIKEGDSNGFAATFDEMMQRITADIESDMRRRFEEASEAADAQILTARGVRQLTSTERTYFQKLSEAMCAKDPKQALTNLDVVMPETVINSVFEDLRTDHELLRLIDFIPSDGKFKLIYNTNGYQEAVWGELCDEIVKELTSGFAVADGTEKKLSAFMPVCKSGIRFAPEWLDRYVREVLYEATANGLVSGIVTGTGKGMPIGMDRQVGPGVTVTDGVYPKKEKIAVNALDLVTMGNLMGLMAQDPNGNGRAVRDLVMVVNPADRYTKVEPAIRIMAPDGTYRSTLPYPVEIVDSPAVAQGEAILGMGRRYFATVGADRDGVIDYSDHYQFLQDRRVYLIKAFGNGFPKDNNAFLRLDISGLQPASYRVVVTDDRTPSDDATLSALTLGSVALSPTFAAETVSYTATTTNATNTINAVPADAGARVAVTLNSAAVPNGSALTWTAGTNTVLVTVTAEDGTTTKAYTITVTKS